LYDVETITLRANLNHNGIDVRRGEIFVGTKKDADNIEIDQFDVSRAVRGLIKLLLTGLSFTSCKAERAYFQKVMLTFWWKRTR
jgi:hypothetical protein